MGGGSKNKKQPQRTGSKKESISKLLKNADIQRNVIVNNNMAAILKASSSKTDGPSGSSSSATGGSASNTSSGFGIKVTLLCLLYLARFGFVMLPQHGYVMPDEFFQSTEPIAGDILNVSALRTWEFNVDFPLRSVFFPQALFGPIFYLIKSMNIDTNLNDITAYSLLVGPRLIITLFSLIVDYSVLRICQILYSPGQNSGIFLTAKMLDILLVHGSSYLAFIYYTHTFSNTIETVLFSLLLLWVTDSTTTIARSNEARACPNFKIAAALAFGFFNRPTFALYAFVPTIAWLAIYSKTGHGKSKTALRARSPWYVSAPKNIMVNSFRLAGPFTIFTIALVLIDTWYYRGSERLVELFDYTNIQNLSLEKITDTLVLTPVNFMIYNLQSKNLSNHGLHPFYFHMVVNFPLMFSLLGMIWFYDATRKLINGRFLLNSCGINILYGSILFVLAGFSLIPHQEPRFLLGLIVPLVCLLGHQIYGSSALFTFWVAINAVMTVFYGHIHQAGVSASLFDLRDSVVRTAHQNPVHVLFVRQYLPPRHLLALPNSLTDRIHLHDLSVTEFPSSLQDTLNTIAAGSNSKLENVDIYLTAPGCLSVPIQLEVNSRYPDVSMTPVTEYFPHFSFEDLPSSLEIMKDQEVPLLTRLFRAFSFGTWKLESRFQATPPPTIEENPPTEAEQIQPELEQPEIRVPEPEPEVQEKQESSDAQEPQESPEPQEPEKPQEPQEPRESQQPQQSQEPEIEEIIDDQA